MILTLVLIIFGIWCSCTHRNLDIHVPVYMINITIPASDNMFGQTPVMFIVYSKDGRNFFKAKKNENHCGLLQLLNANIASQIRFIHLISSDDRY